MRRMTMPVLILVLLFTGACAVKPAPDTNLEITDYSGELTVALYPYVPRSDQFKTVLENSWSAVYPNITLKFVDWDCYSADPPDDLDVFVFDAIYFDAFLTSGYLSKLAPEEINNIDDFLDYAIDGCKAGDNYYAIPQLGCGSALFYKKNDTSLSEAKTLNEVVTALGECTYDGEVPPENVGLMVDLSGGTTCACLYLAK